MINGITNRQMFFLLFITLTTYTVINIPQELAKKAGTGGWVTLLLTTAVFALTAMIIVSLNNHYPGQVLFDYSQQLVGRAVTYIIAAFYTIYFLVVSVYLNIQLTGILRDEFYPQTPTWATLLIGLPVFGLVAYKGVTNMARLLEIVGVIFLATMLGILALMLTQGTSYNILPLIDRTEVPRYVRAVRDTVIAFLGIEVLTVIPFTRGNGGKSIRVAFFTIVFIGLYYTLVYVGSVKIVGATNIQNYNNALIEAIKMIENRVFERFDLFYLTVGLSGLIGGISVVYLAIVEYACRILAKAKRGIVVWAVGLLMAALSLLVQSNGETQAMMERVITVSGLVASILLPTLLWVITKVKKRVQKTS